MLPPPAPLNGATRQARPRSLPPHDPMLMVADASFIVAEDPQVGVVEFPPEVARERSGPTWQLVALLHHDAARAAKFHALARASTTRRLDWVTRVAELHITEAVELPEPERRHLAIGLQVPDGPLMTLNVAVRLEDRSLDQARLRNGPPEWVMKSGCCPEHAATVRALPLNTAARLLERGVTTPLVPDSWTPSDVTEGLRPLVWFVMQRLRLQR